MQRHDVSGSYPNGLDREEWQKREINELLIYSKAQVEEVEKRIEEVAQKERKRWAVWIDKLIKSHPKHRVILWDIGEALEKNQMSTKIILEKSKTMPNFETPEELAEEIANMFGVYGGPPMIENLDVDHPKDCKCRICFTIEISERIKQSVHNEKKIANQALKRNGKKTPSAQFQRCIHKKALKKNNE